METQNTNSCKCVVCNFDVHRASLVKHSKTQTPLENEKIVRTNFSKDSNESNITKRKITNAKPFKNKQVKHSKKG